MAAAAPSSCDAAVPYTLLGLLLSGGAGSASAWPACGGPRAGVVFLRDYVRRGTNALLWVGVLAATWVLLRRLGALLRLWVLGARLPGPPALLADRGLAAVCRDGGDLTGYLSKLHGSYGPIVRLWLGPTQLLVSVKDATLIKEMLTKAEDKLPSTGRTYNLACGKLSLFISSFEKVKKRRESLTAFLNEKLIMGANRSSSKIIDVVLGRMESVMAKGCLDCRLFSQHMAFNILGATLFGDVFFDWSDVTTFEELVMMVAKEGCFWASYTVPPFWKTGYRRYQSLCAKLKLLTQVIIQKSTNKNNVIDRIDQTSCPMSECIRNDLGREGGSVLDGMILGSCLQQEVEGHLCSEEEICGNILGLMLHGSSTTATLISNILTRLVLHSKLQCQLHAEIIAVCNESSKLEVEDVLKMQFLLATVCESARLLPAGPLLQRCSLKHDLNLKSSTVIPAGAILVVPLQLVQMDVFMWGDDACQFNPNRFLAKGIDLGGILAAHGSNGIQLLSEPDKTETFLPFGSGSRACVGQKFAILGISMLIASMLRNYEIRLHPGLSQERDDALLDGSATLHPPNPKIILAKRNL